MRVIVLGSGAREHALAWRLSLDEVVQEVLVLPGNPGMELTPKVRCLPVHPEVSAGFSYLIKSLSADLVVVGPENLLCEGVVDLIEKECRVPVFGPTKAAAQLEGSKIYSKKFMQEFNIATAEFKSFDDLKQAQSFCENLPWSQGAVVKADVLAAGKGVVVCASGDEAKKACQDLMQEGRYGVISPEIIIEERLKGRELSFFALCDGDEFVTLGSARDYKRLLDGDHGPNTGGMGCLAGELGVSPSFIQKIEDEVVRPTLNGMNKRAHPYKGMLFIGLMVNGDDYKVLEYNVRFGDPETQTLLPLVQGPFAEVLRSCAEGAVKEMATELSLLNESSIHVVMASQGYPGVDGESLLLGQELSFEDTLLTHTHSGPYGFMAGVKKGPQGRFLNCGGRVIGVTCLAENLDVAREQVYEAIKRINFEGAQWRKDIGC